MMARLAVSDRGFCDGAPAPARLGADIRPVHPPASVVGDDRGGCVGGLPCRLILASKQRQMRRSAMGGILWPRFDRRRGMQRPQAVARLTKDAILAAIFVG